MKMSEYYSEQAREWETLARRYERIPEDTQKAAGAREARERVAYYTAMAAEERAAEEAEEAAQQRAEKVERDTRKVEELREKVEVIRAYSAWDRGVKEYAIELMEQLEESARGGYLSDNAFDNRATLRKELLNGAEDWKQYSWGGCSLIYDGDIAERLCSPSAFKKSKNGERKPNAAEEWLDVQARALANASRIVCDESGVPSLRSWNKAHGVA